MLLFITLIAAKIALLAKSEGSTLRKSAFSRHILIRKRESSSTFGRSPLVSVFKKAYEIAPIKY